MQKMNIVEMEQGLKKLAEEFPDPVDYGTELLRLFSGGSKTKMLRIKNSASNQSDIDGGFIWKLKLHYAPAEPGNADEILATLKQSKRTAKHKTRLLVVNDGSTVLVFDVKYQELVSSTVSSIHEHAHLFYPLIDVELPRQTAESPIDIKATAKLAKLYDALVEKNPDWLEGDKRHDFNHFMTQVIFCLFAEDTGILPLDIFSKTLKTRAGQQGEYATDVIRNIFNVLDKQRRDDVASWLKEFPYVNGGLFKGDALVPEFSAKGYRYLLEAAQLDWKDINPDILGSSIQAIVDPSMRGNLGMHYTSVPNILKVLEPLFLDDLREELFRARHKPTKLKEFLGRLMRIRVADFAVGSGNFLIIAYRELRKLELQAMEALRDIEGGKSTMSFGVTSHISLSNFYGVELADFAAETAKLGLWIAEYQMNKKFVATFGSEIPALPLRDAGNILCANALRIDWKEVLPKGDDAEIYVCGNPPYLGHSIMNEQQKSDMKRVFSDTQINYKSLDFVTAWFKKATDFVKGTPHRFSFVTTNSICQGSQVPVLWPWMLKQGMEIFAAHTSFKWSNNAANKAGVTCAIIGIQDASCGTAKRKVIFTKEDQVECENINPYLLPSENIVVQAASRPINGLPPMLWGNKPTDGGNFILSPEEKDAIIEAFPESQLFIRRYVGSQEAIKNIYRYVIWVSDDEVDTAMAIPPIRERIEAVRGFRLASKSASTRPSAEYAHRFRQIQGVAGTMSIIVPSVSSESRQYLPCGILTNGEIVSNSAFAIYDGPLWTIVLLASRIHLLWIATVCGKLKTDFRYSNTLGWHTFPVPELSDEQKAQLEQSARKILLTREKHLGATIADLYDPKKMPEDLREAHEENDKLLESIYRDEPFKDDDERLAHLFERYVAMTAKH